MNTMLQPHPQLSYPDPPQRFTITRCRHLYSKVVDGLEAHMKDFFSSHEFPVTGNADHVGDINQKGIQLLEYHTMLVRFGSDTSQQLHFVPRLPEPMQDAALELDEVAKFCFGFPTNSEVKRTWLVNALTPGDGIVKANDVLASFFQQYDAIWEPVDANSASVHSRSEFQRALQQNDLPSPKALPQGSRLARGWRDAALDPGAGTSAVRDMMLHKEEGLKLAGMKRPLITPAKRTATQNQKE